MKRTYTFFLYTIGLALCFEAEGPVLVDPWAQLAWYYHADISSWSISRNLPVHIIVSVLEVSLIVIALLWWRRSKRLKEAYRFRAGTLIVPVLVFGGMLVLGVLYGITGGGDFTFALWEIRGFAMMIGGYLLTGIFIRQEEHLNHLVWVILIAAIGLAIENLLRSMIFEQVIAGDDLAFDHTDSIILACAFVLSLNLLAFGGTRAQRLFAGFALPIILIATEVMKRRAAFVTLAIGVVILVVFLLRLRPRVFWRVVPVVAILLGIYLAIFWNNTSVIGQPARAISSQFTPDPRDYSSNLYRIIEHADILLNIQSAPLTGLGFGQQFRFYIPVPDVGSNWPFWHYTTHNAVLWVWMKDGAVGFLTFLWLYGRGVYDGARAVETQREEWNFVANLRARLSGRKSGENTWERAIPFAGMLLRPSAAAAKYNRRRRKALPPQAYGLNVPGWERTDKMRSVTAKRSGAVALLVTAVCLIPMQLTYSYVDLGLTSERNMLLFGVMIGIIGRGASLLGTRGENDRKSSRRERPAPARPRIGVASGKVRYQEMMTPMPLSLEEAREAVRHVVRTTATPQTRATTAQGIASSDEANASPPAGGGASTTVRATEPAERTIQSVSADPPGTLTPIYDAPTTPLSMADLPTTPLSVSDLHTSRLPEGQRAGERMPGGIPESDPALLPWQTTSRPRRTQ